jgi:hypothetical protein
MYCKVKSSTNFRDDNDDDDDDDDNFIFWLDTPCVSLGDPTA